MLLVCHLVPVNGYDNISMIWGVKVKVEEIMDGRQASWGVVLFRSGKSDVTDFPAQNYFATSMPSYVCVACVGTTISAW